MGLAFLTLGTRPMQTVNAEEVVQMLAERQM